jgi:Domain of unknown function (DUF3883)
MHPSSGKALDDRGEEGRHEAQRRAAIDVAGMRAVREHEEYADRVPKDPETANNEGFDLTSHDADGELLRYIEVKSLAGEWGAGRLPGMSDAQWKFGIRCPEQYWLYVVEHAESERPTITRIHDPVGEATRYYLDPGWRELRELDHVEPISGRTSENVIEDLRALGLA